MHVQTETLTMRAASHSPYLSICLYVCMYVCMYIHTHIYIHIHIYIHTQTYSFMLLLEDRGRQLWPRRAASHSPCDIYIYIYIYIHTYIYIHIHIYIYTQTHSFMLLLEDRGRQLWPRKAMNRSPWTDLLPLRLRRR